MEQQRLAAISLLAWGFLLAISLGDARAQGQPTADFQRFEVYLSSEVVELARAEHLRRVRDTRHPDCRAEPSYRRVVPSGLEQLGFRWAPAGGVPVFAPGADRPADMIWTEAYEVSYCGERKLDNAIIGFRGVNPVPAFEWMPPGETQADVVLTRDLLQQIRLLALINIAGRAEGSCTERFNPMAGVLDTRLHQPQGRRGAPWVERWFIRHCEIESELNVVLTPSARGGTDYAISEVGAPSSNFSRPNARTPRPTPPPPAAKTPAQDTSPPEGEDAPTSRSPLYEDDYDPLE